MKERESYLWEDNIKTLINMGLYSKNPKTIYPIVVAMIYVFSLYFNGFVMIAMLFNSPGTVLDIVRNSEGLSIYIQVRTALFKHQIKSTLLTYTSFPKKKII